MDDIVTIDLRGLKCPLPVLKTARRMASSQPGTRFLVVTDDPMAAIDMPNFCREENHKLISTRRDGAELRFEIERG